MCIVRRRFWSMLVSRMYKLEKLVQKKSNNEIINNSGQVLDVCSKAEFRISSMDDLNYVIGAVAIPYDMMIKYINEYENKMMDEHDECRFIGALAEYHDISPDIFVQRFKSVKKLSKSLIYKKRIEGDN